MLIFCIANSNFFIAAHSLPEADRVVSNHSVRTKKPWTFVVYVAADNNLRDFAARNLKQMATVGSNANINILVHVDIRLVGSKKTTRRYFVEKGKITQIEFGGEKAMDSGDPQTLISACKWAFENYPAEHNALILWNHGTGIIDPYGKRLLNTDELFFYNPTTHRYELDRTVGFLDIIDLMNRDPRGICWDDSTGNYLTNQKLEFALQEITQKILHGQKLDIIGFDACLMAMLEVAQITKGYAQMQVSSQEVELGPGWNYALVLAPFDTSALEPSAFANHIVNSFANAYNKVTNDYTQSALNLNVLPLLEQNINSIAEIFIAEAQAGDATLKNIITLSRSKNACTHFDEPSYIDLHHFYSNVANQLRNNGSSKPSYQQLIQLLESGKGFIKQIAFSNVSGPNLANAQGISVYFPEKRIHPSYKKSSFAAQNKWANFLITHLLN